MNKTPEQIKKGLEHCAVGNCGLECPYFTKIDLPFGDEQGCDDSLLPDTLAYIIDLESNDSQVKKALSDNGFASLEAFLQAYNQVKKERNAAIEELSGVLGKVENAADFIDEEIYCDLDYGTYRNLRDVVDDIAIWENEDKWRRVCAENSETKE